MIDKDGYIHDKIPSNNKYIYTGILKSHTGYNYYNQQYFYNYDFRHQPLTHKITVYRTINGKKEPTSLDEIIGTVLLGFLTADHFEDNWHWGNHNNAPTVRVIQAAIYCAGKDRNFFKRENVTDLHRLAYWVPWHIQYWILARENKFKPSFKNVFRFMCYLLWLVSVFVKSSKKHGNVSQKNIASAILRDLKSPLFIFVNWKTHLIDYFGENHQMIKMIEKQKYSDIN